MQYVLKQTKLEKIKKNNYKILSSSLIHSQKIYISFIKVDNTVITVILANSTYIVVKFITKTVDLRML